MTLTMTFTIGQGQIQVGNRKIICNLVCDVSSIFFQICYNLKIFIVEMCLTLILTF